MSRSRWLIAGAIAAAVILVAAIVGVRSRSEVGPTTEVGQPETTTAALPVGPRTDLRVLIVQDGTRSDPTRAIGNALDARELAYTSVNLSKKDRPSIDADFLADTVDGQPRAKFQAIILPEATPEDLSAAELDAIHAYQQQYGIRGMIARGLTADDVGLASAGGYTGFLDGMTATVTPAGLSGPFDYLKGTVSFPDRDPKGSESFGTIAPAADGSFTPLVTMSVPGAGGTGSIVGVHSADGREDLIVTFNMDDFQLPTLALQQGMLTWLTKGVNTGLDRSAFNVHVDDIFLPNFLWNTDFNCTPGSGGCLTEEQEAEANRREVRMTPSDVDVLVDWQTEHKYELDMVFNAVGVENERAKNNGVDDMADEMIKYEDSLGWINHTWSHAFLGCQRDFSVVPWRCQTTLTGAIRWNPTRTIVSEINRNIVWAENNGIPLNPSELVTGEHGGLRRPPQEPEDNPNFIRAMERTGIKITGADSTTEPTSRIVGDAIAIPRYPVDIYYDTATREEVVDQYSFKHTSEADGGDGNCEEGEVNTCIEPLTSPDDFERVIVPIQTAQALQTVLNNDPRTFYVHQSNLANVDPEGALLYPYLEAVLDTYRSIYADNRPLLQRSFTDGAQELLRQEAWREVQQDESAVGYVVGDTVVIQNQNPDDTVTGSLSVPEGTTKDGEAWGQSYGGLRSDWITIEKGGAIVRTLPSAPWPTS